MIIVGLGNPERKYNGTYHNIGFMTIDKLSEVLGISLEKKGYESLYGLGEYEGKKIVLAKPLTYMNLSGIAVKKLKSKFKNERILVICDDIDLKPGQIRYRTDGSAGTHNGLRSIVGNIGQEFERVRIGIGRGPGDLADYVLSKIEDEILYEEALNKATELIIEKINEDK